MLLYFKNSIFNLNISNKKNKLLYKQDNLQDNR